ncbi:MAG: flagellar biosynthesis protein FlgF [SAR86 cluster bacterium]|uniref:Flagellar basal-body rod protein FlgF n=1 Tax=SAR86 cluster bacterium TaxID=2030880 RepID=A0A2A5CAK1_9GAMM|nr:MAG: flagellar biosynthesis protein FlgF [SAR86 cluster bacterium]
MNELLVTAMNSARQIMQAQAVNTNNLANVSTDGFKAEIAYLSDVEGDSVRSIADLQTGNPRTTGRSLDISINGEGWIAIMGADGSESYSRRGDLKIDAFGQLSDGIGRSIMGNNGPIALPPFATVEIAVDGTISIQPLGQGPNTMAVIDRIKLVLPDTSQLKRGTDGLLSLPPGETIDADASVRILSGSLEGSNVNAVAEMVKMIDLSRRFEAQINLMQTAQENSAALSKIMSLN